MLRNNCVHYNWIARLSRQLSMAPSIYTRTGDQGESGLYSGHRLPKSDLVFEVLGTTDELASTIGVAIEQCRTLLAKDLAKGQLSKAGAQADMQMCTHQALLKLVDRLIQIQCRLQDINSHVATPRNAKSALSQAKLDKTSVDGDWSKLLEEWIDEYAQALPPLRSFILPSGGLASAQIHVARSVCRRAERRVHQLISQDRTDPLVGVYLNRLSDFLFMAARYCCKLAGNTEESYTKQPAAQ